MPSRYSNAWKRNGKINLICYAAPQSHTMHVQTTPTLSCIRMNHFYFIFTFLSLYPCIKPVWMDLHVLGGFISGSLSCSHRALNMQGKFCMQWNSLEWTLLFFIYRFFSYPSGELNGIRYKNKSNSGHYNIFKTCIRPVDIYSSLFVLIIFDTIYLQDNEDYVLHQTRLLVSHFS